MGKVYKFSNTNCNTLSEPLRMAIKEVNVFRCSLICKTRTPDMEDKSACESAASVRFEINFRMEVLYKKNSAASLNLVKFGAVNVRTLLFFLSLYRAS